MRFSAPVSIGTNTGASGSTLAITVGAAGVPAGATIFVLVTEKSTSGTSGTLADTAGNTYSTITAGNLNNAAASGRGTLFAVTNCKALVNTNTITYTRNLSASSCAMSAFYVTGVTGAATFTEALATATGSTGTITVTSGTLGAGRLVLGALFDSGTSVAGGNATFTNAAGFVTPPVQATTGGSGGSRAAGGTLFKAATGTQVYAPTLSSTAQVWFLAVLGIIPNPDAGQALENRPPLPTARIIDFQFPNIALTAPSPSPPPLTNVVVRPPLFMRQAPRVPPVDFQAGNIVLNLIVPPGRPVGGQLLDQSPLKFWHTDYQFPNVALRAFAFGQVPPVGEATQDTRPAPVPRRPDFLFPNVIVNLIVPPGRPVGAQLLDQSPPRQRQVDVQFENIALTAPTPPVSNVIFRPPLYTYQTPTIRTQDAPLPNLAIKGVVAQAPVSLPIFERPVVATIPRDLLPPNIPVLAAAQAQVQPVGTELVETVPRRPSHQLDFQFPNLLILTAMNVPSGEALTETRPRIDPHQLDFAFPNIAILNAARLTVPPVGEVLDEVIPRAPSHQLDFAFPNVALAASAAPTKPAGAILDETRAVVLPRQLDFAFPNIPVLAAAQAQVEPVGTSTLFERPIATHLPIDAPIPNILITTLSVVSVKPIIPQTFSDRSPPAPRQLDFQFPNIALSPQQFVFSPPLTTRQPTPPQPQDAAPPNLLVTLLSTVQGTPFRANITLFTDRPLPQTAPQDKAPINLLTTTTFTQPVKPPVANFFLLADRPTAPSAPIMPVYQNLALYYAPAAVGEPPANMFIWHHRARRGRA